MLPPLYPSDSKELEIRNLGIVSYDKALDIQADLIVRRRSGEVPDQLILLEHPHVITMGTGSNVDHVLADQERRAQLGIELYETSRGGDVTYHGPGQLVVYPIFDLDNFFTDIHKYLRFLEDVVIGVLKCYGLIGERLEGATGVWLGVKSGGPRKICAMGVRASRWVTMHGLAFNVSVNLDRFNGIVPCGIMDKSVTSLEVELKKAVILNDVSLVFQKKFKEVFQIELLDATF